MRTGDPKKVTIWGESAGSQAVDFHLVAYGGRDDHIFRAAIMESGNPVYWISLYGPDHFQSAYDDIVGLTGCNSTLNTLQCLRELPVDDLQNVINSTAIGPANWTTFAPVMDGDFLQRYTSLQLEEGQFVKVPILSGSETNLCS
jgi:carboxylesterase type B